MTKIALLHKGPVRPGYSICLENIKWTHAYFKSFDYRDFIFAWNDVESRMLTKDGIFLNSHLIKEPTNEYIDSIFPYQTPHGCNKYNAFKHFWMMKYATETICNAPEKFTHVIYTRMDTRYDFIDIPILLNDKYSLLFNYVDLVGIAPPEIMKLAWDYKNMDTLNELYKNSNEPEGCWKKILEMNKVEYNVFPGFDVSCDPVGKKYNIRYELNKQRNRG